MKIVVVDTNFLLMPFQFRIDIFTEIERLLQEPHEIVIPSGVLGELEHLKRNRGNVGRAANLAFSVVGRRREEGKVRIADSRGNVDDWITEYAIENGAIVCTNDLYLKKRLLKMKMKIIIMREKSYLAIV